MNSASEILRKFEDKKGKFFGIMKLKLNNAAVIIQINWKGQKARKLLKILKNEKACEKLRFLFTRSYCTNLTQSLRLCKKQQNLKATVIGKYARRFLAMKQLQKMKEKKKISQASEIISRYLRGYWHFKMINWLRQQLKAILIIQTHWRVYKGKFMILALI